MRRAAACPASALVERDSSLSLLPCWCTWVAQLVLVCERMAETWSVRMNDKPQLFYRMCVPTNYLINELAVVTVQALRGGTCAIWLCGWRPQYGVQSMMMITLRSRSRGRHSPAACPLYILLDSRLAAPCVLMLTTMGRNVFLWSWLWKWTPAVCQTSSHDFTASLL